MFTGILIKYAMGPTWTYLARPVRRGLKRALRRAQNIFMPKNINCTAIVITLEGTEKVKTEKKGIKQSEEFFFQRRCKKTSVMASQFFGLLCIIRLFDSHFSWFINFTAKIPSAYSNCKLQEEMAER